MAAGRWGLPGGKLEEGESLVECVLREVLEETGLELKDSVLLRIVNKSKSKEGNTVVKFVFLSDSFEQSDQQNEHEFKFVVFSRRSWRKARYGC